MRRIVQFSFVLPVLAGSWGLATVHKVPAESATIQTAVERSMDGDTIIVAPGTYTGDGNRDIDFKGKAITLKSEGGAATCTINCQGSADEPHRAFYFHNREDANSVVQGFTITGGFTTEDPSLWAGSGGGIHCYGSSPRIVDCIITGNVASIGGGVACVDSNSVLIGCTITANETRAAREPPMSLTRSPRGSGGGIAIIRSCPVLANCLIAGNRASYDGGGVLCAGDFAIVNCTISGNRASRYGCGGGICVMGRRSDYGVLRNCILWANTAGACDQILLDSNGILGANRLELTFSTIQGGQPRHCLYFAKGNWTDHDPLFANPGHWDPNGTPDDANDDFWVEGDYHLKSQAGRWDAKSQSWIKDDVTSPCIDTGDPNSPIGDEPEPNGGRINMGAYAGTAEASMSPESGWAALAHSVPSGYGLRRSASLSISQEAAKP